MGSFTRSGAFKDRERFIAGLKSKIDNLKDGPLRGMDESWEPGPPAQCVLSGMGVRVVFVVNAGDWSCDVTVPSWIPIPQTVIEERFDREFEDLGRL